MLTRRQRRHKKKLSHVGLPISDAHAARDLRRNNHARRSEDDADQRTD